MSGEAEGSPPDTDEKAKSEPSLVDQQKGLTNLLARTIAGFDMPKVQELVKALQGIDQGKAVSFNSNQEEMLKRKMTLSDIESVNKVSSLKSKQGFTMYWHKLKPKLECINEEHCLSIVIER